MIRWESESDWKAWETSAAHIAGHRANRGKPKLEFSVDNHQEVYHMGGHKKYVELTLRSFVKGFFDVLIEEG